MCCHKHSIDDFDLQIEINELDMQLLCEDGKPLPYHQDRVFELQQKKHRLYMGKRFHQNAKHCNWYWMHRAADYLGVE